METSSHDEAEILRLDSSWNEAYLRCERERLVDILAYDFAALLPSGEAFGREQLMANPGKPKSAKFTEQSAHVFGNTAISRGRLQVEWDGGSIDQRFLRVFTKREGIWRAISVAVTPVPTGTSN